MRSVVIIDRPIDEYAILAQRRTNWLDAKLAAIFASFMEDNLKETATVIRKPYTQAKLGQKIRSSDYRICDWKGTPTLKPRRETLPVCRW